jgi:hypothetical protein
MLVNPPHTLQPILPEINLDPILRSAHEFMRWLHDMVTIYLGYDCWFFTMVSMFTLIAVVNMVTLDIISTFVTMVTMLT